jgi:hypothetical protein
MAALPVMVLGALLACATAPVVNSADDTETGIRGTMLMGPVEPGPTRVGQSDEMPFSAVFVVFASGKKVASFESDENGHFRVALPPGSYTIVPTKSAPMPLPTHQTRNVLVPGAGFVELTLHFDTGMK